MVDVGSPEARFATNVQDKCGLFEAIFVQLEEELYVDVTTGLTPKARDPLTSSGNWPDPGHLSAPDVFRSALLDRPLYSWPDS